MFCPPEYVHFHKVLNLCKRAALLQLPIDNELERIYHGGGERKLDAKRSRSIQRVVIEQQMLKLVMAKICENAFAFSPPDRLLAISKEIVMRMKTPSHILRAADSASNVEFLFINSRTGKIDLKNLANRLTSWFSWLDEADRKTLYRCNLDLQSWYIRDFGEIDGWVICFDPSVIVMSEKDVRELWKKECRSNENSPAGTQGGVGQSLPKVWTDVWQAFPDGKGLTSWGEVEKRSGHSRRQINRALDEYGGRERWAGGGQ